MDHSKIAPAPSGAATELQPFTISPTHFGGRKARKGFAFQDWWIAYTLVNLLERTSGFTYARVEGVEDLDVLLESKDVSVEKYFQLKSRDEGTGAWTPGRLKEEGVIARFAELFVRFISVPHDAAHAIELIAVLEGDVNSDVIKLREGDAESVERAFLSPLATAFLIRDIPSAMAVRDEVLAVFQNIDGSCHDTLCRLSLRCKLEVTRLNEYVQSAYTEAQNKLTQFQSSVRIESRAPAVPNEDSRLIEDASVTKLLEQSDLSPVEARSAIQKLIEQLSDECNLPVPTLIDRSTLLTWMGIKPKPPLEEKPDIVSDYVDRIDFKSEFQRLLDGSRIVLLYGLSKIGKSQFVSKAISELDVGGRYFWFTFTGAESDQGRLFNELSVWVGRQYGSWQLAVEPHALTGPQHWARLVGRISADALLIIDDTHKACNFSFAILSQLQCRVILISESKIPAVAQAGIEQVPFPGFSPKEALGFLKQQGIDPSGAVVELASMAMQLGGHPLMLRVASRLLPTQPTSADVAEASAKLPSVTSVKTFLDGLSSNLFFKLLQSQDQRELVARLAALSMPFDERVALALAEVNPPLRISLADWRYLSSMIIDPAGPGKYTLPALLKTVAEENLAPNVKKQELWMATAAALLRPRSLSHTIDLVDFEGAVLAYFFAEEYVRAARTFVLAIPKLFGVADFGLLRFLFTLLNSEKCHAALESQVFLRWQLLLSETMFRAHELKESRDRRNAELYRRMRRIVLERKSDSWYFRIALLGTLASTRIMAAGPSPLSSQRTLARLFAPVALALRIALRHDAEEQVRTFASYFQRTAVWNRPGEIELLKDSVLFLDRKQQKLVTPDGLLHIYGTFAAGQRNESDRILLEKHACEYKSHGFQEGYTAARYGLALYKHEAMGDFSGARATAESLLPRAKGRATAVYHRLSVLIADTYWAEKKYENCAGAYRASLAGHHAARTRAHVQNRLIDSLIELSRFGEAANAAIRFLRKRHRSVERTVKVQLYARLAFALAENGKVTQAATACRHLERIARESGEAGFACIAVTLAAWVLQHLQYSDIAITRSQVVLESSSTISVQVPAESIERWKQDDPLQVKARFQIGAVYELQREFRRARAVFLDIANSARGQEQTIAFALKTHLVRAALGLRQIECAAQEFADLIDFQLQTLTTAEYMVAYATWDFIEPILELTSDELMSAFANGFCLNAGNTPRGAAIRLRQAQMMFKRLLVQGGRRVLSNAIQGAEDSQQGELLQMALAEQMFVQVASIYRNWDSWFCDIVASLVRLCAPFVTAECRSRFAESTSDFMTRNSRPLSAVDGFCEEAEVDRFAAVAHAIAVLAEKHGVSTDRLKLAVQKLN